MATQIKTPADVLTPLPPPEVPRVYTAINQVMRAIGAEGISKDRRADQGPAKYAFRGIDDVMNALSPLLVEAGLAILPRLVTHNQVERTSGQGRALFYTTVEVEFDFVSMMDGSMHTVRMAGEAMDSSDKSTNKAMSAALKYACLQAFMIPTEGDNDTENSHHEEAGRGPAPTHRETPEEMEARLMKALNACTSLRHVEEWDRRFGGDIKYLEGASPEIYTRLGKAFMRRKRELSAPAQPTTQTAPQTQAQPPASGFGSGADVGDDDVPF